MGQCGPLNPVCVLSPSLLTCGSADANRYHATGSVKRIGNPSKAFSSQWYQRPLAVGKLCRFHPAVLELRGISMYGAFSSSSNARDAGPLATKAFSPGTLDNRCAQRVPRR